MERLQAFEEMLKAILAQAEREKKVMDDLKAQGKEKNRLMYSRLFDLYRKYGLLE